MPDHGVTEVWRIELARGLRCLADGDPDGAEAYFASAHRRAPERPEVCFALGRQWLRQDRLDEAEPLLASAWAHGLLAAAAALARCRGRAGRRAEGHDVLDEALRVASDEAGLLVVRAELLLDEGRRDEARVVLERAAALVPPDAPATRAAIAATQARHLNDEGIALAGRGEREAALFAFKRAFDLDPGWASPLVNMGAVLAELGRPARARACYERALVLDPENAIARHDLALLLRARGDVATAERELRRAITIDPDHAAARLALAEILCGRGEPDAAFALLGDAPAGVANALFEHGGAAEPVDAAADAEQALRALVADDAHQPGACLRLARLLAGRGAYDEAARLLQLARRGLPARP
jgi:tetratricopeptide (TPR) repeat protein